MSNKKDNVGKDEFDETFKDTKPSATIHLYLHKTDEGEGVGVHCKMVNPDNESEEVTEETANVAHYIAKNAVSVIQELLLLYKAAVESPEQTKTTDDSSSPSNEVMDEIDRQLEDMGLDFIKPNDSVN